MTSATALFQSPHVHQNGFRPRRGFQPFDPADAESTLAAKFRQVARLHGGRTALVEGERSLTYSELLDRSETIAEELRRRFRQGGVVAICQPSALATVENMLGALLGDCAYFCIEPSLPRAHIAELLQAAAPVYLAGREHAGVDSNGAPSSIDTHGPAGIAALYATSGSTGEPKLVALSHHAILFDIGRQTNDLYLGPDDRFDSLFSFAFSAALATTFGALLHGAELHCQDARRNLAALPDWLEARRITVSTMTVSMLRHLCLSGRSGFPHMRLLSVGGETLQTADVAAFRSVFPAACVLQNAMASTETRTYAQYFVPATGEVESPVPIGWPVAGKEVSLLDEAGSPVSAGQEGEIAVRSRYLASGYSNDPRRTAEKFLSQPDGSILYRTGDRGRFRPDGTLLFLGRTDSQVKIRGHRVELDAVAAAVESHPEVRTAVVVARADSAGNQRLVAYVVAQAEATPVESRLREFLSEKLASYAIPSAFVFLPELPLNANFKVDRRRLPVPPPPPERLEPAGAVAMDILREIWKSILQRTDVPADCAFCDLGGDSLAAVRVLVAIHRRLGCDLPPDSLHRFPTLRLLTAFVEEAGREEKQESSLAFSLTAGTNCPFFFVAGLGGSAAGYEHLAARLAPRHPAYGLNTRSGFSSTPVSVESMAAEQVAQVARLAARGQPIILVGCSFGGTVAFEMARQIRESRAFEPLPIVIDMPAVNAPGVSRPVARRAMDVVSNLPAWMAHEAAHFQPMEFGTRAYGHLRRMGRSVLARPANELDPMIYFGKARLPESYQAFLSSMFQALLAYVPARFEGPMVLLRAQAPTLFRTTEVDMGWRSVAAKVEVLPVPGSHDDCASAQHSEGLARVLSQCASRYAGARDATPAGSAAPA